MREIHHDLKVQDNHVFGVHSNLYFYCVRVENSTMEVGLWIYAIRGIEPYMA